MFYRVLELGAHGEKISENFYSDFTQAYIMFINKIIGDVQTAEDRLYRDTLKVQIDVIRRGFEDGIIDEWETANVYIIKETFSDRA